MGLLRVLCEDWGQYHFPFLNRLITLIFRLKNTLQTFPLNTYPLPPFG